MCKEYSQKVDTLNAHSFYANRKNNPEAYAKYLKKERKRRKRYEKKDPVLKTSFRLQCTISGLFQRRRKAAKKGNPFNPSNAFHRDQEFSLPASTGYNSTQWLEEIEKKLEPGMNWVNYGRGGWKIEYLVRPSKFDLKEPSEMKKAFNPNNCKCCWYPEQYRYKMVHQQFANKQQKQKFNTIQEFYDFFMSIPEERWGKEGFTSNKSGIRSVLGHLYNKALHNPYKHNKELLNRLFQIAFNQNPITVTNKGPYKSVKENTLAALQYMAEVINEENV